MYPEVARTLEMRTKRKARTPRPKTSEAPGSPPGDGVAKTGTGGADPTGDAPPDGETPFDADVELPLVTECPRQEGPVVGATPPEFCESPSETTPGVVAVADAVQLGAPESSPGELRGYAPNKQ